jgi:hypothetical protein
MGMDAAFGSFGLVAASLGHRINGQMRMENLYARAAVLNVGEDIVRELIAAEQSRTETSVNSFNWERVENQIDHKAGGFG